MKTYLEIKVPLRYDAIWFEELRRAFQQIEVKWQAGFFHITMAFIDDTPEDIDISTVLQKHLCSFPAPTLTFNKLDVFNAVSGMFIIYLTATNIPQNYLSLVQNIRSELKSVGCVMNSDFRLHVTLGRIKDSSLMLSDIKQIISKVSLPAFSLNLEDVDYRIFRGQTIYEIKLNN